MHDRPARVSSGKRREWASHAHTVPNNRTASLAAGQAWRCMQHVPVTWHGPSAGPQRDHLRVRPCAGTPAATSPGQSRGPTARLQTRAEDGSWCCSDEVAAPAAQLGWCTQPEGRLPGRSSKSRLPGKSSGTHNAGLPDPACFSSPWPRTCVRRHAQHSRLPPPPAQLVAPELLAGPARMGAAT